MTRIKPIYHILFWIFMFFFVFDYLEPLYNLKQAVLLTLIEVSIYVGIFYINFYLLIPKLLISKNKLYYGLGLFIFLTIISIGVFVTGLGYYLISESDLRNFLSFSLNFILFVMISFLYWYVLFYQQDYKKRLVSQNEKLQTELLLLKSQVSPHFLFNSLNNIYSLSLIKHDNTPIMIEKLANILRYIIYEGKNKTTSLKQEVLLLNNYIELHLLKKLKGEKNVIFTTKGINNLHKIEPLLLIIIIENCFKHSDIAYNQNGFLNISLKVKNDILYFETKNSFKESTKKVGIGFKNLKKQLQIYYPNNHQFIVKNNNGIFTIHLKINIKY